MKKPNKEKPPDKVSKAIVTIPVRFEETLIEKPDGSLHLDIKQLDIIEDYYVLK